MKPFSLIVGIVMLIVAALHALRIAEGWQITFEGRTLPMSLSYVAAVVAAILGIGTLVEARR
jgi:hypothetical protein